MAWRRLARVVQLLIVARGWERERRGGIRTGLDIVAEGCFDCAGVLAGVLRGFQWSLWEEEERLPRSGIVCTSLLYVACVESSLLCGWRV